MSSGDGVLPMTMGERGVEGMMLATNTTKVELLNNLSREDCKLRFE